MINYDFSSLLSTFGDCILDFSQPIILILYFEILAGVILFPFLLSFCHPNRSSYNKIAGLYKRTILSLYESLIDSCGRVDPRINCCEYHEFSWLFSFCLYFIYSSRSTFFVLPFQYFYLLYPCFFFKGPMNLIEVYTGLNPYPSYHIYYYPTLLIVIFFLFLFLVGLAPQ